MTTAKFLFWLGIIVMIVEFFATAFTFIHYASVHAVGTNWSNYLQVLFGSFFQGGVLIGLGKILEAMQSKK